MANFEDHYTVKFSRLFMDYVSKGKIKGVSKTDIMLLEHITRGKVKEYGTVKLIDETLCKYENLFESTGIKFKSLEEMNAEKIGGKRIFNKLSIYIDLQSNVLEIRLPWLTREKFDPLIKFFKEELDMEFENRKNQDPVWFTLIRDERIFDDLRNNELVKKISYEIDDEQIKKSIEKLKIDKEKQKKLFRLSTTANLSIESEQFKGIFERLYPFQKVAVEYSKFRNGILIADEMGLGKSLESLAIIEYHQLYPAVIIVPAMLRKNWRRETVKWLPHKKVSVIESQKIIPPGDVYIVSYSMISRLGSRFFIRKPKVIVADECFIYDTKISTNKGLLNIGDIVENKLPLQVLSKNQNGEIEYKNIIKWHKYKKDKRDIILKIKLQNDIFIYGTPNHNIYFGDNKYVRMDEIKKGDELFILRSTIEQNSTSEKKSILFKEMCWKNSIFGKNPENKRKINKTPCKEKMQDLWKSVFGFTKQKRNETKILFNKLFSKVENVSIRNQRKNLYQRCSRENSTVEYIKLPKQSKSSETVIRQNEKEQSNVLYRKCTKNDSKNERKNIFSTGWKWTTIGNRNRWPNTPIKKMEIFGQTENGNIIPVRVESIEILEFGSRQQYSRSDKENKYVYDITLENNHNYFANGILVSNSHFIKNPNTARTDYMLKYFKDVEFKILTTGTPILNRTVELVPQLELIGVLDTHFGGKRKFIKRYAPPQWNGYGTTYGSANEEELQIELRKSCMIRRMKKDVIEEMPEKIRQVIPLPLSDRNAYEKVEYDSINWYETKLKQQNLSENEVAEKVNEKLMTRSAYAEKMVRVEYLRQAAVAYKIKAVFEWIDDTLEQVDKLVIFAHHRDTVEKLYEKYEKISVMLYGGMTDKVEDIVNNFIENKKIKLFIGSITSSGIGIDGLQKVCDRVAFVELAWTPALMSQAEDRCHRIGQKNTVNIYYLIADSTIEEYIYNTVVEKEDIFEKTTNINKLFEWIKEKQKKKK